MSLPQNHYNNVKFVYQPQVPQRQSNKLPEFVKSCFLRRSASDKQLQKFNIQNIIARSTFTGAICTLCEIRYKLQEMVMPNQNCGHSFCQHCIHNYLIYRITVSQELACPQQGCTMIVDKNNPCFLQLPEEYKNKYEQFQLWKQTLTNPNLKLCPVEKCKGMINVQQSFACNICRTQFCRECMLKVHAGPCDDNFQKNFKQWKRCPQCAMFIQRTEGCNHMTCRCSHQFCYVCLADWNEEHYQCGANGINGIPQQLLVTQVTIRQISRCNQILYAFLMILFLPIAVLLLLLFFVVCVVGGVAIAIIISPCALCSTPPIQEHCQSCCPIFCVVYILLMPLIMVCAAIGSFFIIAFHAGAMVVFLFAAYLRTAAFLFCNSEPQAEEQPYLEEI